MNVKINKASGELEITLTKPEAAALENAEHVISELLIGLAGHPEAHKGALGARAQLIGLRMAYGPDKKSAEPTTAGA